MTATNDIGIIVTSIGSLLVSLIVGGIGIYLAIKSEQRDARLKENTEKKPGNAETTDGARREAELENVRKVMQRDIYNMQQRIDFLEEDARAKDEVIHEQRQEIDTLKAELEIYKRQFSAMVRRTNKTTYASRKLAADDLKVLRLAMLDCFSSVEQWEGLVQDAGLPSLDILATGESLAIKAQKLLTRANNDGTLAGLMAEAAEQRANVSQFVELVDNLLKKLGA